MVVGGFQKKKERYPANRFGTRRICMEITVVHLQKTRSPDYCKADNNLY